MSLTGAMITRREALRRTGVLLGGALSASTAAGVLAGCERRRSGAAPWSPQTLTSEQNEMVVAVSERIIPETDTPGAKAARVNEFIDAMLTDYYPEEERDRFLAGLMRLDERAARNHGSPFLELDPRRQVELLTELDRVSYATAEEKPRASTTAQEKVPQEEPLTQQGENASGGPDQVSGSGAVAVDGAPEAQDTGGTRSFFRTMKELTLVGYYTSEPGATQELRVNPMGSWRADVPYEEIGHAWA